MMTPEEKRHDMLNSPVELLVCKMAVPTIITMLITALYNMADTYFVGRLDTISTASVGLALPLMNVIQAIGFFFGQGSGNYMARKLGAGDSDASRRMADTASAMSFSMGIVFALVCFFNINSLVLLLGATPLLIDSTIEYVSVMLVGIPFVMTSFTLNNQLRFQGNAFYGMIGMASGAVLNVALDPIFIFVFDMGVRGAALATVISETASFAVLLVMSFRNNMHKPVLCLNREIISALFRFGTPSLFRQSIMSIATICLNHAAGNFGEAVIAAVSVVSKIIMMGASVVIGFGHGFQPVCGFNNGAKRYDRIKRLYVFCIKASTIFMLVFGAIVFVFAPELVAFFRDGPDVISAGTPILRLQCVTAFLQGLIMMTNMIVQNMGKTFLASFLAIARQGVFFIPLVLVMPRVWGFAGLEAAQSAADVLTAAVTFVFAVKTLKNLDRMIEENKDKGESI